MYLTRYQAEHLSNFGKLLVLGGAVWGVSRAAPSLRKPALCIGVGAACWYVARKAQAEYGVSVDGAGRLGAQRGRVAVFSEIEEGAIIDVTPTRLPSSEKSV